MTGPHSGSLCILDSAVFGDSCLYGDLRWGGSYGVDADFIASSNVIVKSIDLEKIEVSHMYNDEDRKFQYQIKSGLNFSRASVFSFL